MHARRSSYANACATVCMRLFPRGRPRDCKKRKRKSFAPRRWNRRLAKSLQSSPDFRRLRFDYRWLMLKKVQTTFHFLLFNSCAGKGLESPCAHGGVRVGRTKQWLTCEGDHHDAHELSKAFFLQLTRPRAAEAVGFSVLRPRFVHLKHLLFSSFLSQLLILKARFFV